MMTHQFSSIITKEGKLFVSNCPELDITSQGKSIEEAISNLKEAILLYLEDEDVEYSQPDFRPMITLIEVE